MNDERIPSRTASLGLALRRGFSAAYDHLGYVVFVTFASFVSASVLTGAAITAASKLGRSGGMAKIVLFLPVVITLWLFAVGVYYYAKKSVYHEYPTFSDTWTGIKTLLGPALKLLILDLAVTVLLLGDTLFFLSVKGGLVFQIVGVLCGYIALVWMMMAMYHLPLLVAQLGMESGPKPMVVVRKSFLLVADNPGFTVGLFLVIIALAVICAVLGFVGMAVFYLGATAFVLTHALRELFIKYGIVEDEPETVEDKGWPGSDRQM
jgi:hypothetical protein